MRISEIIKTLEAWAPPALQEDYDNSRLITGNPADECTGVLCCLDATEAVLEEALQKGCNLVVAHHPILFRGIKTLSSNDYVTRTLLKAVKHNLAIYAIHTNLDNVATGVNFMLAQKLGLVENSLQPLRTMGGKMCKLTTYIPSADAGRVRDALFEAGAGQIGNYNECSFNTSGQGTFRPLDNANPAIGKAGGPREWVEETRVEMVFPRYLGSKVVAALIQAHPYETPAYDIIGLDNHLPGIGSGMVGMLPEPMEEKAYLQKVKDALGISLIRHTRLLGKPVQKVALCGGSGSFLTTDAIRSGAHFYITADVKYHEFFDADDHLVLADVGHFESEQFTIDGLAGYLRLNFPTFAVLKTGTSTNPVHYLF